MYREVGLALKYVYGKDTTVKPTDYLKFFCLGKTLTKRKKIELIELGEEADMRWRLQIFVHSKVLMVEDKFILEKTFFTSGFYM